MDRAPPARRTSPVAWSGRALLAGTALVAAYVVGAQSLANAMRHGQEQQAFALAPWDGMVTARYARSLITAPIDPAQLGRADSLARRALAKDPMAIDAIITLGTSAQLRGDTGAARKIFAFAQTLSRRELQTQLWAIEDAVGRGDIPEVLRQYDIALRTSRNARSLLFPILASAIGDPAIATATARTLAEQPRWAPGFIFFAASEGPDPAAAAGLFARLNRLGVPVSEAASAALIQALTGKGRFAEAWALYAASHPGSDRLRSRDPHFANDQDSRSVFDWQLFGDAGVSTTIERGDDGNVLAFTTAPGAAGLMARQLQLLQPGSYILRGRSARIDLPEASRPFWQLECQDGRTLGRVVLPNSSEQDGTFTGAFDVPAGCPAQYLSLIARPNDIGGRVDGEIHSASLDPAR